MQLKQVLVVLMVFMFSWVFSVDGPRALWFCWGFSLTWMRVPWHRGCNATNKPHKHANILFAIIFSYQQGLSSNFMLCTALVLLSASTHNTTQHNTVVPFFWCWHNSHDTDELHLGYLIAPPPPLPTCNWELSVYVCYVYECDESFQGLVWESHLFSATERLPWPPGILPIRHFPHRYDCKSRVGLMVVWEKSTILVHILSCQYGMWATIVLCSVLMREYVN